MAPTGPLTAPDDNPFRTGAADARWVWSLGHRHPQGLAFDAAGRLWETEHGPSGERHGPAYPGGDQKTGRDELNLVVGGGNYGWPLVSGPGNGPGFVPPVAVAGDSPAWAPGDLAVGADGSLYAPFLAGAELHRFDVRAGVVVGQGSHLTDRGRLRVAVTRGTDLLVAQDQGTGAVIFRLPLDPVDPSGSDPALLPAPPPIVVPPGTAGALDAREVRTRTRLLARALGSAVREAGRGRLLAGRAVTVRSAAPSTGTTVVSLRLRDAEGPVLSRTASTSATTGRARYGVQLGRVGRRRLDAGGSRVVLRVVHRPVEGPPCAAAYRLVLPRR